MAQKDLDIAEDLWQKVVQNVTQLLAHCMFLEYNFLKLNNIIFI